ncbi:hypothetical protein MKW98_010868 [Papaver atlanticum]|uniref:DNA polymerase n=1 Tax=Papaver atlanticum TaxID=357466 RepID=A0AAD4SNX0_9MAGN|nr:hypothetical protein MKW98_010868 [Papaver atlanticum]
MLFSGVDLEGSVKEEPVVKKANDSARSAAPILKSVRSKLNVGCDSNSKPGESSSLLLNSDGSLPFYFIDAHEELYGPNSGIIYLFGKVKEAGGTYGSCCAVVNNMQRCVYVIPNGSVRCKGKWDFKGRVSLTLQEMASVLKKEVKEKLFEQGVLNFTMTPVKRSYVFERPDIPMGEQYVLKITYPFKYSALPPDLKGEHFSALLGTNCRALEHFLIKRKITGPSWLSFLKVASCSSAPHKVSWCKFEVTVDDPKEVRISKVSMQIPPVIVTSINLKTVINEKQNVNEIVSASVINCCKAKIDSPTSEWEKPGLLKHLTIVRKLEEDIFPMGFEKEFAIRNAKDITLSQESTEAALLNRLFLKIYNLDTDILVGHNISGFDLDVLLHRAQACQVKSHMWSKIGCLKRSAMPKLTKADTIYGSGASRGIMTCTAGRLICDTYLCSRDLLKEVSYSLTPLAKTQLNKDRREIASHEIPKAFQSSRSLMELVECGEADARLSMELMFHLSILPLTRQLSNISGNLWGKTLQGARAQGVENLLLHKFHAYKYIVPDNIPTRGKNLNFAKRRLIYSVDGGNVDNLNTREITSENDLQQVNQGKRKKGPAYSGGLVLEPKKGLYDKYILLLDFNSLYPSIIREYNICFTTVERSADGSVPQLPSSKMPGILPELLKALVERREKVKESIKTTSGLDLQQLDILQQALKLTANRLFCIYGCLGYYNSRFYAKPLAELITSQGREILQSTVDLVQNDLKMEVIYGDTDSIMINSGLDDVKKSKQIASEVIKKVNKKYEYLVTDLDAMFKRMLLLKKKKYVAVKVQFKDGKQYEVVECKGLEMVRRDWSLLSKEVGDFCLSQILSGGSGEDVVVSIHNSLMKVQKEMRKG